ncbi:hypothetical protein JCM3765_002810 [Sporobolomyces pararoseus]
MSDSINDLFDTLSQVWDSLVPAEGLPNLHQLPHQLHEALFAPGGVFDKLTNGGTVPLPVPSSWLESASSPPPPPSIVSPPRSSLTPRWIQDVFTHLAAHPYVYTLATLSATTGATYYYSPRTLKPLISLILPASVLPVPKNRPMRLLPSTSNVAAEIRKEAVLVLGADTFQGREIALDLEKRGWVVIATVSDPDQVDRLEREGRGWIKVLVLDPTESSSVSPFLRSLSTALSLRFPLHTSGDPFSRPSHTLSLTSLIDCPSLPLSNSTSSLIPLEAVESDQIKRDLTERIATFILVTKGVLPFLRNSSQRPGAPTAVHLLLLPSISSNVSLPFESLSSSLSTSLESMFHSLRRELLLSTPKPNLQLSILQIGSFEQSPSSLSRTSSSSSSTEVKPLPIRLSSLYAPALSRRIRSITSSSSSSSSNKRKSFPTSSAPLSQLTRKVSLLLLHPSHSPVISLTGTSSWIYYYLSPSLNLLSSPFNFLFGFGNHHRMIDWILSSKEWLINRYELYKGPLSSSRKTQSRLGGGSDGEGEKGFSNNNIPEILKPGGGGGSRGNVNAPNSVPTKDGFFVPNSSTSLGGGGGQSGFVSEVESSTSEESEDSSIEDLGISTESIGRCRGGGGDNSVYMTGSFVNV